VAYLGWNFPGHWEQITGNFAAVEELPETVVTVDNVVGTSVATARCFVHRIADGVSCCSFLVCLDPLGFC
jgi:hypothetical protein